MTDGDHGKLVRLFTQFGVRGDIRVAVPVCRDEAVFVVSTSGAAVMREAELVQALMKLLDRRIWLATDGEQWDGKTIPLREAGPNLFGSPYQD